MFIFHPLHSWCPFQHNNGCLKQVRNHCYPSEERNSGVLGWCTPNSILSIRVELLKYTLKYFDNYPKYKFYMAQFGDGDFQASMKQMCVIVKFVLECFFTNVLLFSDFMVAGEVSVCISLVHSVSKQAIFASKSDMIHNGRWELSVDLAALFS